jgi:hypothetical protein
MVVTQIGSYIIKAANEVSCYALLAVIAARIKAKQAKQRSMIQMTT